MENKCFARYANYAAAFWDVTQRLYLIIHATLVIDFSLTDHTAQIIKHTKSQFILLEEQLLAIQTAYMFF